MVVGSETKQMQLHRLAFGEHFVKQYGANDMLSFTMNPNHYPFVDKMFMSNAVSWPSSSGRLVFPYTLHSMVLSPCRIERLHLKRSHGYPVR